MCFIIIVGMGRTCVYVHHVDKEAFLKGNVEPDPDELDMVFESSPSYAQQVTLLSSREGIMLVLECTSVGRQCV